MMGLILMSFMSIKITARAKESIISQSPKKDSKMPA